MRHGEKDILWPGLVKWIPFLIPYYREIVVVDPRYYYDDIEKVMKKDNITSVLFLYNGNTFVKDNSISGVLQND